MMGAANHSLLSGLAWNAAVKPEHVSVDMDGLDCCLTASVAGHVPDGRSWCCLVWSQWVCLIRNVASSYV